MLIDLPSETVLSIFLQLPYRDILTFSFSGKRLYEFLEDQYLWRVLTVRDFSHTTKPDKLTWKKYYQELFIISISHIYFTIEVDYDPQNLNLMSLYQHYFFIQRHLDSFLREACTDLLGWSVMFFNVSDPVYEIEEGVVYFYFPVKIIDPIPFCTFNDIYREWCIKINKSNIKGEEHFLNYGENPSYEFSLGDL